MGNNQITRTEEHSVGFLPLCGICGFELVTGGAFYGLFYLTDPSITDTSVFDTEAQTNLTDDCVKWVYQYIFVGMVTVGFVLVARCCLPGEHDSSAIVSLRICFIYLLQCIGGLLLLAQIFFLILPFILVIEGDCSDSINDDVFKASRD